MTTVAPKPIVTRPWPVRQQVKGSALARILRTTDAKQIGIMYMITAFVFYILGGFMALLMRTELARPGMQLLSPEQYNQLFTMHGTIMLLFFATPIVLWSVVRSRLDSREPFSTTRTGLGRLTMGAGAIVTRRSLTVRLSAPRRDGAGTPDEPQDGRP